ncbi:MAG: hypothetical protein M3O15_10610, partial [Acidobacteriota bacterium]|nr:hypothetical protein [Acidobacteriota bacterium]
RGGGEVLVFAGLAVVLCAAAQAIFLLVLSYTPRPWYYLPLLAVLASALDTLCGGLAGRFVSLRVARLAAAVLVVALLAAPTARRMRMRQTDMDLVARQVERQAAAADLVVVNPWFHGVSFNRYYHGAAPWITVPEIAEHRIHRYDLVKAKLAASAPIDDVRDRIAWTLSGGHRVFWVGDLRLPPLQPVTVLPPAPGSPWGWHDLPYLESWSRQLEAYIQGHARTAEEVAVPGLGPVGRREFEVSRFEDVGLVVISGWER